MTATQPPAAPAQQAQIRPFLATDTEQAVALWDECGLTRPWNDPRADIERALGAQPEFFLAATTAASASGDETLVGTVMAGYDGHRGWMYYLATAPSHRGTGLGRRLVREVERLLEAAGCPKAMLMVRSTNARVLGFYDELGYEQEEVLVLSKRLIHDAQRTA